MFEWKAVINNISSVDSAGKVEIIYSILINDVVFYPNMIAIGPPQEINSRIADKLNELKISHEQASSIQVGDVIIL